MPPLPQRPPSSASTAEFETAIAAARQRLVWLTEREKEVSDLLAAATAEPDGIRPRAEAAERLAGDARTLLPYTGGEQSRLRTQLDQAAENLGKTRPGWWRESGATLTTAEEVEAARQRSTPA